MRERSPQTLGVGRAERQVGQFPGLDIQLVNSQGMPKRLGYEVGNALCLSAQTTKR
jgi:hypothetical protein